jgi:hypothetical protein
MTSIHPYFPSQHPLLKQPDSASGSRQVAAAPSAPVLRTSTGAIFIRFN